MMSQTYSRLNESRSTAFVALLDSHFKGSHFAMQASDILA